MQSLAALSMRNRDNRSLARVRSHDTIEIALWTGVPHFRDFPAAGGAPQLDTRAVPELDVQPPRVSTRGPLLRIDAH